jgi:hypothetical protein
MVLAAPKRGLHGKEGFPMRRLIVLASALVTVVGVRASAQELILRPGADLGAARYSVEIEAEYGGDLTGTRLTASYGVIHRSFTASQDGVVPALLVFDGGTASVQTADGASPLNWNLTGEAVLVLLGPDNVAREAPVPLPALGAAPAADALAAYASLLWAIPYPAEALSPGESFIADVTDEPSLAGPVLVCRRVVGELASVESVEGRQVAILAAQVEQSMAPDHPTLTGQAVLEVRAAVDVATGRMLGATLLEFSETANRPDLTPAAVAMEPLRCTVRLDGGPDVGALLGLP